jgi:hypothetical protein
VFDDCIRLSLVWLYDIVNRSVDEVVGMLAQGAVEALLGLRCPSFAFAFQSMTPSLRHPLTSYGYPDHVSSGKHQVSPCMDNAEYMLMLIHRVVPAARPRECNSEW